MGSNVSKKMARPTTATTTNTTRPITIRLNHVFIAAPSRPRLGMFLRKPAAPKRTVAYAPAPPCPIRLLRAAGGWRPPWPSMGQGRISIGGGTSASLRSGRSAPEYRYRNKSGNEPAFAPPGRATRSSIRESRDARK
ncbi:Uncharacterised protein [Bordetella pertussis]|nr:Uncharacterised protein [Bordetella pertussis]